MDIVRVMARTGRPKKPPGEVRTEMLTLRLTKDEMKACRKAAAKEKRELSEWAREKILGAHSDPAV